MNDALDYSPTNNGKSTGVCRLSLPLTLFIENVFSTISSNLPGVYGPYVLRREKSVSYSLVLLLIY